MGEEEEINRGYLTTQIYPWVMLHAQVSLTYRKIRHEFYDYVYLNKDERDFYPRLIPVTFDENGNVVWLKNR